MQLRIGLGLALIVALFLMGCTTTTERSRARAAGLHRQVSAYAVDRRAAIDAINASYRATYSSLLGQYRRLSDDRLRLERDADARAMADALLLDWKRGTTFTAITRELTETRDRQFDAMESRDAAIAAARRIYAESYSELDLELKKLEQAKRNLADLSQEPARLQATIDFLLKLGEAWETVRAAAD